MIADKQRFDATIAAFDAANAEDPNRDEGQPKELLYARRMSAMLARFAPDAPEAVRLAARAQHLQRWKTPRTSYPADRQGYLQWRSGLYRFHAETAGRILRENGYDAETTERVQAAVGKKALKLNADTQLLEDTADLVFLEHYLAGFMARHADYSEGKWLDILRKTWQKMSPGAREFVLAGKVSLPETAQPLLLKAIS
ncbi:MAG: hypothetical protein AMXMBFR31_20030 [Candidatus Desulfobacillus denitrificans]|jgi:hypothetical protein|uniref:DUF4202 domain-containing protein n=1 Tax=Candidatus Desulfobacillus denitrificans TaxID=2608985 RepID=A0A809R079_9PROT|nr:DUF4202 domain-containing protein [Rhodocyclaceae bacterium]MCZ2173521.1 DUF4202 domain-containing protein [Burkholderiales bacterium]OQY69413.1 MAG: hypothetical protein B6D47_09510 [Rhodocyclaceae bacterium UTPRO2]BBO20178.1 conserved hypothetical protein [Candidatus Desulfobacillus denitrificans]GIK46011.1 MAG: hypothetical protein BroJett012_19140 [Betaproteobacteria bacterium]